MYRVRIFGRITMMMCNHMWDHMLHYKLFLVRYKYSFLKTREKIVPCIIMRLWILCHQCFLSCISVHIFHTFHLLYIFNYFFNRLKWNQENYSIFISKKTLFKHVKIYCLGIISSFACFSRMISNLFHPSSFYQYHV